MEKYKLTIQQEQILEMLQIMESSKNLTISGHIILHGDGEKDLIQKTIDEMFRINDTFRVQMKVVDGNASQWICDYEKKTYDIKEFDNEADLLSWEQDEVDNITWTDDGSNYNSLYKITGFLIRNKSYGIFAQAHHIVSDAVSHVMVGSQFRTIYDAYKNNEDYILVIGSFKDYIENNEKYINSKKYGQDRDFWIKEFSDLKVGTYISDKPAHSYKSNRLTISTNIEDINRIKLYCKEQNISFFVAYMCALSIYSSRINRSDLFNIGTTIHSRLQPEEKVTMGMYVNTVVLRVDINKNKSFDDLVKDAKVKMFNLFKHHKYNYTKTIKDLYRECHFSGALYDVIVNYQTVHVDEGGEMFWYSCAEQLDSLSITIRDWNQQGEFEFDYDYQVDKFNKEEIELLHQHVLNILLSAVEQGSKFVQDIDVVNAKEYRILAEKYANINVDYPKDKTIIEVFEGQVRRYPDQTALVFKDRKVTYKELNKKVNIVARELRKLGVTRNKYVAVIIERSIEMVIGVLAVVKAGGTYVPMDQNYPIDRLKFMTSDCNPVLILKSGEGLKELTSHQTYDIMELLRIGNIDTNPTIINEPSDNLYVIYTSGTTGHPKGVIIEHKNVIRLLFNDSFQYDFKQSDVWLLFHYFGFDFSVWEMYGSLLYGGKLIVLSSEEAKDTYQVEKIIDKYGVTVLNQVPSAFYNLMLIMDNKKYDRLRYLIFGGEELRPEKLERWYLVNNHVKIVNMYGITETTVHVTYKDIGLDAIKKGISDIGKEIPTLAVYIMNDNVLSGIGMPGEICVAGEGLGKGYLHREELTKEKFIKNPFGKDRLYRSGDLGRRLPDGNIEYLGRIDEQVKVHGFRIELGEISHVIRKQQGVKDVVVVVKNDQSGQKDIFAYLIGEHKLDFNELKANIRIHLPEYMVPKYYMQLDEFPITKNGKLDKSALQDIKISSEVEYQAARTEAEDCLVKVFSEVLNVNNISTLDNFYELGGDSIKVIRVVAKLREYGYCITPKEIMELSTIENICKKITKTNTTNYLDNNYEIFGYVSETPIYSRFKELKLHKPEHFNQAILLKANEKILISVMRDAMRYIAEHHDMLRAIYREDILRIRRIEWGELYELKEYTNTLENTQDFDQIANTIHASMNLIDGPLFKGTIIHDKDCDYLLVVIHHLVVDGVSMRIILEDLCNAYDCLFNDKEVKLPSKTCSFIDWSNYLHEYIRSNKIKREIKYWHKKDCDISKYSSNCKEQNYLDISRSQRILDKDVVSQLLHRVRKLYNMEIDEIVLAAISKTYYCLQQKEEVLVEMEGHGREKIYENIDLSSTVGWFTSIYPVLLSCNKEVEDNMILTKDTIRNVKKHGFSYGVIRYMNEIPLCAYKPDLIFNYLGDFDSTLDKLRGFTGTDKSCGNFSAVENGQTSALIINCFIKNEELQICVESSLSEYSNEDMEVFLDTLSESINEIIKQSNSLVEPVITATDVGAYDISQEAWNKLIKIYN